MQEKDQRSNFLGPNAAHYFHDNLNNFFEFKVEDFISGKTSTILGFEYSEQERKILSSLVEYWQGDINVVSDLIKSSYSLKVYNAPEECWSLWYSFSISKKEDDSGKILTLNHKLKDIVPFLEEPYGEFYQDYIKLFKNHPTQFENCLDGIRTIRTIANAYDFEDNYVQDIRSSFGSIIQSFKKIGAKNFARCAPIQLSTDLLILTGNISEVDAGFMNSLYSENPKFEVEAASSLSDPRVVKSISKFSKALIEYGVDEKIYYEAIYKLLESSNGLMDKGYETAIQLGAFNILIDTYTEKNLNPTNLVSFAFQDENHPSAHVLAKAVTKYGGYAELWSDLVGDHPSGAMTWQIISSIYELSSKKNSKIPLPENWKEVRDIVKDITLKISPNSERLLSQYENTIRYRECSEKTIERFIKKLKHFSLAKDIESKVLDVIFLNNSTDRETLGELITADTPPFPPSKDKNLIGDDIECLKETEQVVRRSLEVSYGFESLTFESKRPGSGKSLLEEYFFDHFKEVYKVRNSEQLLFPGNGFCVSGLKVNDIFALEKGEDPFIVYKKTWDFSSVSYDKLSLTDFFYLRSFIALSTPGKEFEIDGIHYSYIVRNEHFFGYPGEQAYLIPTSVLKETIYNSLIPLTKESKKRSYFEDTSLKIPTFEELLAFSGKNYFNLSWGSNLGGGLCNAAPPDNPRYHFWEKKTDKIFSDWHRDFFGHMNKSLISGDYDYEERGGVSDQTLILLKPLQKLHNNIYLVSTIYQDIFDLNRIAQKYWHVGWTRSNASKSSNGITSELTTSKEDQKVTFNNPDQNRILEKAYEWHNAYGPNGENRKDKCPILTIVPMLDYMNKPTSDIKLDTYSLTLSIGDDRVALNSVIDSDAKDKFEKLILKKMSFNDDLRFFSRDVL